MKTYHDIIRRCLENAINDAFCEIEDMENVESGDEDLSVAIAIDEELERTARNLANLAELVIKFNRLNND